MPKKVTQVRTPASVQTAANVFQETMTLKLWRRLMLGPTEFGRPTGSLFDAVDDDPPGFQVFAMVPTSRSNGSAIHLYAWDRGEARELQVVGMAGFAGVGLHAGRMVRRYLDALATIEPKTEVVG